MAHPNPIPSHTGSAQHPLVDRPEDLALEVPTEEAPGADEVDSAPLSVAVTFPDWRLEELAHKYAPRDAYEPDQVTEEF